MTELEAGSEDLPIVDWLAFAMSIAERELVLDDQGQE